MRLHRSSLLTSSRGLQQLVGSSDRNNDPDRAGRWMVRIAIVLWCIGVGSCVWLMIRQNSSLSETLSHHHHPPRQEHIRGDAMILSHPHPHQQQLRLTENILQEQKNQDWIQRSFVQKTTPSNNNNNNVGIKLPPLLGSPQELASSNQQIQQQQIQQQQQQQQQQQPHSSHADLPLWVIEGQQQKKKQQLAEQQSGSSKNNRDKDTNDNSNNLVTIHADQANKIQDWEHLREECQGKDPSFLRPTHGCALNYDTYTIHCHLQNFRVDVSKVHVKAKGGESIASVLGRPESDEFPTYRYGAFSTLTKPTKPIFRQERDRLGLHYLEPLLLAMEYPTKKKPTLDGDRTCVETWTGTTLFVTRYEYCNLYHTMTDWWNAYFSSHHHEGYMEDPIQVVFLDAHAQGNLDSVWHQLFGQVRYITQLPPGGVCFANAVLIPPGYSSALFPQGHKSNCPVPKMADEFVNFILQSYGLQQTVHRQVGTVVVIDRKPYLAHPRSHPEKSQRILDNMNVLVERLTHVSGVQSVELIQLETLDFATQVSKIRQAHVLIGYHGAGLTHVLFMDQKSHVIEFTSDYLAFFQILCDWRPGVDHTLLAIDNTQTLSKGDIERVAAQVETIMVKL
jgi:hypothetical protein